MKQKTVILQEGTMNLYDGKFKISEIKFKLSKNINSAHDELDAKSKGLKIVEMEFLA